jgi:HPt (histidine-containing phosphotransfer) domain-containing protein
MTDVFDSQELLEELDGDREFLEESLEMLDRDAPALLKQIREALERDDAEAVSVSAHTLKSMVGNFCAPPAFDAALDVEKCGRSGDLSACGARLESLEMEVSRLQSALHEFLNESW